MIRLTANSFIIQKEAENPADCQDACDQNDEKGRYAIADGVTRSFFPKEWATLLVEHFCESMLIYAFSEKGLARLDRSHPAKVV